MVDRLGHDKKYWIVFLEKYPFISKKGFWMFYRFLLRFNHQKLNPFEGFAHGKN